MLNDRFSSKVSKSSPDGCWEWIASKNNKGYGMFSVNSFIGKRLAHRLSYENARGKIPSGALILHSCDNPACVNPDHLRIGTYKANVADMDERNRRRKNPVQGERHYRAKITAEQVIALRREYIAGAIELRDLADKYGVTYTAVQDIVYGRSWSGVLGVSGAPSLADLKAVRRRAPGAKITREIASEIKRRLAAGETGVALAATYGIHKATVSDIRQGKIWGDA